MLVLSRRQNERILLGDSVVVTVVRVSGEKVRIGIEAPPEVRVWRDDLGLPRDAVALEGAGVSTAAIPADGRTVEDPPLAHAG
jgi:carbon storage regulator